MHLDEALGEPGTQRSEWIGQLAADEAELGSSLDHWLGRVAPELFADYRVVGADIEAIEYHGWADERGHPAAFTLYLIEKSQIPPDGYPGLALDDDGTLPVVRLEVSNVTLEDRTFEDLLIDLFKRIKLRISPRGLPVDASQLKPVDDIAT